MARASPIIHATNAGELSPTLDGRVDLAKYASGCKRLENFLTLVQGPAVRRGGSRFVQAVKDEADRCWLLRFEFSATQAFILEFGDLYVRFYTDHGVLETGSVTAWSNATAYLVGDLAERLGVNYYCILAHTNQQPPNATYWYPLTGNVYEIPSPYALTDLTHDDGTCALVAVQSGDVLYIANKRRTYQPRKLTRASNTNWVFSLYAPVQGPFLETSSVVSALQASAASGGVTITATNPVFASTDVGRLIRLESQNLTVKPWETGKVYAINDLVRSDGKTYKALTAATSGTSTPVHERGTAYDGQAGVQWEYQNAGYGVVTITGFTSSTQVSGTVVTDQSSGLNVLPADVVSANTARWQLGAWSNTTEWPSSVTFFRSRLWWAGRLTIWGSVPDDFESMAGDFFNEVTADSAISRIVTGQDVNDIEWIIGADKLVIGTGGGEFACGEVSTSEPLGPGNFAIIQQSQKRSRSVAPVSVSSTLLYLQRAGRKLLSLNFSVDVDKYISTDLAVLAERITRTGVIDMAYQGEPYSILWCVLSNGKLLGFTYDLEQDVTGWQRHPIGGNGFVEAVNVIPGPDGSRDDVWLIVKRTINGATHRYVEFIERPWEGADEDGTPGDAQSTAFYVDSGLTYNGAATTAITGLSHLEGETVQILADGARQPDKTVSGGAITLDIAASVVHAGLQYTSRLVPMRLEAGSQDGTAQGKIKRLHEVIIRFFETLGGKCGRYGETLDELSVRDPSTPMGTPQPVHNLDWRVDFPGDYDRDALIEIVQDEPLPMTVTAIMPQMRTYG